MSQEIKDALLKLNPKEDKHWTNDGLPAVAALGINGLTRAEITKVAPQFTRDNPTLELPDKIAPTLLGSDAQPSIFTLADDTEVQLGTVVADAHEASELSVEDWNALEDEKREELIQAQVNLLDLKEEANEEELQDSDEENDKDSDEEENDDAEEKEVEEGLMPEITNAPAAEFDSSKRDALLKKKEASIKKMEETSKIVAEAQKEHDAAIREYDDIENQLEAALKGRTTQHDIMDFIKSQGNLRAQRAALQSKALAGIDLNALGPAPIDKAMARKTQRGAERPQRTPNTNNE